MIVDEPDEDEADEALDDPDEDEIGRLEDWGKRDDQDDRATRMKFKD